MMSLLDIFLRSAGLAFGMVLMLVVERARVALVKGGQTAVGDDLGDH